MSAKKLTTITEEEVWPLMIGLSEAMFAIWERFGVEHPHLMDYAVRVIEGEYQFHPNSEYRRKTDYFNSDYKSERSLKRYKLIYHPKMQSMLEMLTKKRG